LHALKVALRGCSPYTVATPTRALGCHEAHDAWTLFALAGEQALKAFRPAATGLGIERSDPEWPEAHAERLTLAGTLNVNTWMFRALRMRGW
jgi:hypothetical protein